MNARLHLFVWIIISGIMLCSCSAVKRLQKPELDLPDTYGPEVPVDSFTIADLGWWEFYGDEHLKELIAKTLDNNKRLGMAAARIEQSRHLYNVEKAKLLPELSFTLPWNNETNDYYQENKLRDPEIGVKATISWEADLFGKLNWGRKRSQAQYLVNVEDERALRMTLVAEVATAYFRLVAYDIELGIVRNTMATREEGVRLAKIRYEGGLTSETVYRQAQVQYATAAALIPNLEYNIKITENALAVLMGEYPGIPIPRSAELKDNTLPGRIPAGFPSTLLERRPDIRATEGRLKAAAASVGITYASRFPSLTLGVTGGWENDHFRGLFQSPFSFVVGNFVAPLFDFGKRKNNYEATVSAYNEARLSYEQKVLESFQEVEDALSRYNQSQQAVRLDAELLEASFRYQVLTWKQYEGGTINYIDVLDAQRRYLEARIALANARRDEYLALIQLYKALGGGWSLQP